MDSERGFRVSSDSQSAVSEVADVSEVTIRNRYRELLEADGRVAA